ncbi:MAG: hypothetical protein U1E56_09005 [Bauldia sp.]
MTSEQPRILIVEDEFLIGLEIRAILQDAGFSALGPARSVGEALDLLDRYACAAAVLDINLGDERSDAVARQLRAAGIPFVTLSGQERDWFPDPFEGAPALSKPVDTSGLVAEMIRAIRPPSS